MYSIEKKKVIKYIYIDLIKNDKMMDIEKFKSFVEKFQETDPIFIFDYNCLEYPYIMDIINILNSQVRTFIIKCDKCKHIDIIEQYKNIIIPELHVKIDTSLSYEKLINKLSDNIQLFNYYKDLNKNTIYKCVVDLFVNKHNIVYLRETLKILTNEGFICKIIFDEYALNGYYKTNLKEYDTIDNSLLTYLSLDDILRYKHLLIDNRNHIHIMFNNLMNLKCWKYKCSPIQLCISPNFKFRICNKIDYELDLDPFNCFDGEYLKDDIYEKLIEAYKKCCSGCNCEDLIGDFINEIG